MARSRAKFRTATAASLAVVMIAGLPQLWASDAATTAPDSPDSPVAPATRPSPAPLTASSTLAALQNGIEDKRYREVLAAVSHVLSAPADPGMDRYPYWMLKAECLLQLRDVYAVNAALSQALKATPDPAEKQLAEALQYLIKKSTSYKYIPRHSDDPQVARKGVDIIDRISRQRAFGLLFADEMEAASLRLKEAKVATSLPPIVDAARQLAALPAIERAATGKTQQTADAYAELGQHAVDLMGHAVAEMADSISHIKKSADEITTVNVTGPKGQIITQTSRRGLDTPQRRELNADVDTIRKLPEAARELEAALHLPEKAFKQILEDAEKARQEAVIAISRG